MNRKQRRAAGKPGAVGPDPTPAIARAQALAMAAQQHHQAGRLDQAIAAMSEAARLDPPEPDHLSNLGVLLQESGRFGEAAECFRRALALAPGRPLLLNNLGFALHEQGDLKGAIACYEEAIRAAPTYPEALYNHANALRDLGRFDEAVARYSQALRHAPNDADIPTDLGNVLMGQGKLAEATRCFERALASQPANPIRHDNLLSCALYREDLGLEQLAGMFRTYGAAFSHPEQRISTADRNPNRRLRIGYLSSDLYDHPVGRNLMPIVRHHDRGRFELRFYAGLFKPDGMTEQFRALAEGWTDVSRLSDVQAAERIRGDKVDILVSLAGRFDRNRPTICGWRAAPIQISLHDGATSGLTTMDYLIGDRWMLPRRSDEYFSERKLRLPTFWVLDAPESLPPASTEPRSRGPVFCSYNNPAKIGPSVLALWGRILEALPEARLVLRYQALYGSQGLSFDYAHQLVEAGARFDQIEIVPWKAASSTELMESLNEVDIALDPFPFCGRTTSFQALSMGLPVITLSQRRMISSGTEAMLHHLGLEALVASSAEDYIAKAVAVATHRAEWRARRAELQARMIASPLCDGASLTRNLERLYRAVWRRHCAANPDSLRGSGS